MPKYILVNELKHLIQRYLQGKATEEEQLFLDNYYDFFGHEFNKTDVLDEQEKQALNTLMLQNVKKKISKPHSFGVIKNRKKSWLVAASIFFAIITAVGIYYYTPTTTATSIADVAPGTNKATLTLADGTTVLLDSSTQLSNQDQVQLDMRNGHLSYTGQSNKLQHNTMTTPRGGQYRVTLSDGTSVWLNAQSSLDFPVTFIGQERKVALKGEAYFEVAKDKTKPFIVFVEGKGNIEVLGTHFNVTAYPNDNTLHTTLLEGSVKIAPLKDNQPDDKNAKLLVPGQQAVVTGDKVQLNRDVDMDAIMAWKKGKFYFEDAKLETILESFSRWYDVDIVYECSNEIKARKFFIIMDRSATLNEVLKLLQMTDIKFIIEGKKLIVR